MAKLIASIFILTSLIAAYPQPEDSIFVIISGDTVHVWNTGAYENCGCLFNMDVIISNDTIYVTEVDTASEWAFCMCYFDLCTSLTGLQNGVYFVEVFRFMPLSSPDTVFIGSTSFTYGGSVLAFFLQSYQSDCYSITESRGDKEYPKEFVLKQNYPNPFNPTTTIRYVIPERALVTIKIYDILGDEITTLVNEEKPIGNYEVDFIASNLSSGVYFYKLTAGDFIQTKKMILLR
jgi:hypothetical protein